MTPSSHSLYYILIFAIIFLIISRTLSQNSPYIPSENIALNCGSSLKSIQYDGRNWTGDIPSNFIFFGTNSTISNTSFTNPTIPQIPYSTARVFYSKFTYKFSVTVGWKFIRLHFYPSFPNGMDSRAFLTVTACSDRYTLLHNFSASLNADYLNQMYLVKEFIVYVNESVLDINFSPSSNVFLTFAFVNGIEVVSMPQYLYCKDEYAPGIPIVGQKSQMFYISSLLSMETCYRVNVGGDEIPSKQDTGMFRSWKNDENYIFGAGFGETYSNFTIELYYSELPPYTAPELVYRTARSMGYYDYINLNYNMTWFFPVDSGFWYLVRLHFCELDSEITKVNQRVFDIFINNQTAQIADDVIGWSGGFGVPMYQEYVVWVPKVNDGEKQDLWLDLHPNKESKPSHWNVILNGLEIFKLSDNNRNLAGLNPPRKTVISLPPNKLSGNQWKKTAIIIGSLLGGIVVFVACLLLFGKITTNRTLSLFSREMNRSRPVEISKILISPICHCFSLDEIKAATSDFREELVIGTEAGFGNIYKGFINGEATMIIVCRGIHQTISQTLDEIHKEIIALSQLRHQNLVCLLGYCLENDVMILVYEYMPNGTLYDHLRDPKSILSWDQWLKICIGAARGLHYLHTGSKEKVNDFEIKSKRILLDEKWEAKISHFGLSKLLPIEGTCSGYLDTQKNEVYSFGEVLLDILFAKITKEVDISVVDLASHCTHYGKMDQIIVTSMEGKIKRKSFVKFVEIAKNCLATQETDRPSMAEVLWNLELSLQLQHGANRSYSLSDANLGIEFSEVIMPLGR